MIRLFVGLEFPPGVKERLSWLGGGVPGARWVEPENFHLTLRFIGEVEDGLLGDIDAALAAVSAPAFEIELQGVGTFGSGARTRTIWAGVVGNPALHHLQQKVERALVLAGMPPEERKFAPHVTLARLKGAPAERVGRFIEERGLFRAGPFPVDHFTLFESRTGRGGPVYTGLGVYPLD